MLFKPGKTVVTLAALSFTMTALPVAPVYAALVSTESLASESAMAADRERVSDFFAREDVRSELRNQGVNPDEALARVAALSDSEINRIAMRLDELPAGQSGVEAVLGVALTVFIILLITDILCVTSVFNFTRCAR
jgi:hypothetical protein